MSVNDQLATLVAQLKERRAVTFQDRIKSLDIRDDIWRKYIELNKGSSFDAIAAQRTGLCPDMCCERERLTREYQRLCKSYEYDPDTRALNHSLMVTEYSRASADQAMPSPYDLRSGPVLLHTMNYLITTIMDKFDQEREQGDWYNFLWDRLRAIRKELTQQHLRDEVAIEILEQCARFHIFCAAFLSEYSRDLFDPRLNDKALIDCLNQLRDCYINHKKQNNQRGLKNLPEFSSYMLLINLKDDNETLLRIRDLIQDITGTTQINIALNIHRSLLLNNTTKFFSLIEHQTTLLQSCLLNRYFNIIRSKRLSLLITSTQTNNDEFHVNDLTNILGMDNDDETKDYLEQLGYSVSNNNQTNFIIPSTENMNQQQPIHKLSYKLIKSKYNGNLKDIITGYSNTPVVIPDMQIEDSFDVQGYFIGKMPFDLDTITKDVPSITRRPVVIEQQPLPSITRPQPSSIPKRPPSESALKSIASATIKTNPFAMTTRLMPTTNIVTNATTTIPSVTSPFRFSGFPSNPSTLSTTVPKTTTNPFTSPPSLPGGLFTNPSLPRTIFQTDTQSKSFTPIQQTPTPITPEPIIQPPPPLRQTLPQPSLPPPAVVRRLSMNSMDTFVDELYEQMIDPLIQETTYNIFDELISQWNNLTRKTVDIYNELLSDEINSIIHEYYTNITFHQRMLNDTIREENERKRTKYLKRKYFILWFEKTSSAKEERFILNELQIKYNFHNNEQLFEFLTGLQLILEHDLTIEETTNILKSRRYLKKYRLKQIEYLANLFFDEFLHEEFHSIVNESNSELELRQTLLENALKKQSIQKREHYLHSKYFSLWFLNVQQRKKLRKQKLLFNLNNKRLNQYQHIRSNKKLKDNNQQYQTIKNSFDQLTTDLNQIQLFIDKLNS